MNNGKENLRQENGYSLRAARRLLSAVLGTPRTTEGRNRHLGQAAFTLHQAAPQNPLYQSADKLQAHRLPCRHRRAGRGDVLPVSKTTLRKRRRNRTAQSGKPNDVGCENEQYP